MVVCGGGSWAYLKHLGASERQRDACCAQCARRVNVTWDQFNPSVFSAWITLRNRPVFSAWLLSQQVVLQFAIVDLEACYGLTHGHT